MFYMMLIYIQNIDLWRLWNTKGSNVYFCVTTSAISSAGNVFVGCREGHVASQHQMFSKQHRRCCCRLGGVSYGCEGVWVGFQRLVGMWVSVSEFDPIGSSSWMGG